MKRKVDNEKADIFIRSDFFNRVKEGWVTLNHSKLEQVYCILQDDKLLIKKYPTATKNIQIINLSKIVDKRIDENKINIAEANSEAINILLNDTNESSEWAVFIQFRIDKISFQTNFKKLTQTTEIHYDEKISQILFEFSLFVLKKHFKICRSLNKIKQWDFPFYNFSNFTEVAEYCILVKSSYYDAIKVSQNINSECIYEFIYNSLHRRFNAFHVVAATHIVIIFTNTDPIDYIQLTSKSAQQSQHNNQDSNQLKSGSENESRSRSSTNLPMNILIPQQNTPKPVVIDNQNNEYTLDDFRKYLRKWLDISHSPILFKKWYERLELLFAKSMFQEGPETSYFKSWLVPEWSGKQYPENNLLTNEISQNTNEMEDKIIMYRKKATIKNCK
ncbi:hypothetical protein TRFO_32640 [Tritrichomonas foetus]|uniref:Uncharacterized protein n=1 Tax=Tritrichomonas foetus TaxID=1144522 RepID=A0A1J4JNF6_9EUKA|nr:hypothetical protein TRFO_32640 [Tritrichomonas foetus]|eukprot:OHT00663.1 hypothetical protein TRFO_32640 [Tritrichomonas foetus]